MGPCRHCVVYARQCVSHARQGVLHAKQSSARAASRQTRKRLNTISVHQMEENVDWSEAW